MLDMPAMSVRLLELAREAAPRFAEVSGDPMTVNLKEAGLASVAAVRSPRRIACTTWSCS